MNEDSIVLRARSIVGAINENGHVLDTKKIVYCNRLIEKQIRNCLFTLCMIVGSIVHF